MIDFKNAFVTQSEPDISALKAEIEILKSKLTEPASHPEESLVVGATHQWKAGTHASDRFKSKKPKRHQGHNPHFNSEFHLDSEESHIDQLSQQVMSKIDMLERAHAAKPHVDHALPSKVMSKIAALETKMAAQPLGRAAPDLSDQVMSKIMHLESQIKEASALETSKSMEIEKGIKIQAQSQLDAVKRECLSSIARLEKRHGLPTASLQALREEERRLGSMQHLHSQLMQKASA